MRLRLVQLRVLLTHRTVHRAVALIDHLDRKSLEVFFGRSVAAV
jgi:hypothetical protein